MTVICDKLKRYLDENRAPYEVMSHGEAFTSQEIAASMHVSGRMLVKVVMVKGDKGLVMVALPAHLRVDLAALRGQLGMRLARVATEEEFARMFPDCEVGAMPPFGNLYGIPVYVDEALAADPEIVFQAGNHYEAVRMAWSDFERLVKPRVLAAARKAA